MRVCRYLSDAGTRWGVVEGDAVRDLQGDPFGSGAPGRKVGDLDEVRLVAPCEPTKVVCAGRNYRSLLKEQNRPIPEEPFLFLKAPTAVVGPEDHIYCPAGVKSLGHEGELAVVIARTGRDLPEEAALEVVLGYTCGNDITVRDWQHEGIQWLRAKSSDTHCPIGPWIETDLAEPENVGVRTLVNGDVRQDGRTNDLVFGIAALLSHISRHMTLRPGDVVLTGTPAGIRPVYPGDVVEVEVEGIGTLVNHVKDWPYRIEREAL